MSLSFLWALLIATQWPEQTLTMSRKCAVYTQDFHVSSSSLTRETHIHRVSESLDILPPTGQLYWSKQSLLLFVSYTHTETPTQPRGKRTHTVNYVTQTLQGISFIQDFPGHFQITVSFASWLTIPAQWDKNFSIPQGHSPQQWALTRDLSRSAQNNQLCQITKCDTMPVWPVYKTVK